MSEIKYQNQVRLLLDILPDVATEECFAMHGGTALNLFMRDMPRLSVDIDLTYLPIQNRDATLAHIEGALRSIRDRIKAKFPAIHVTEPFANPGQAKLFCSRQGVQIKVEVNTTMRGALGKPVLLTLCQKAQEAFDRFAEMRIMPMGQLYGGKICAALDRQHPRDLFDVKYMLEHYGFSNEIKRGFLLCLLSSDRPIHEMIRPTLIDQRDTMANHFIGMTEEPFSYDQFEETRHDLIETINTHLTKEDRSFLISFKEGEPAWTNFGFAEFENFPAPQWKLQNVRKLKISNPVKHGEQLAALKERLGSPDQ
jgi:predicted nucleotidyltransferase component of viral defense system